MEGSRQAALESKVSSLQQQLVTVQDAAEQMKAEHSSLETHHRQVRYALSRWHSIVYCGAVSKDKTCCSSIMHLLMWCCSKFVNLPCYVTSSWS